MPGRIERDQSDQDAATNCNGQQGACQLPDNANIGDNQEDLGSVHLVTRYRSPYFSTILVTLSEKQSHFGNV